ncbi:stalk domain-containing protein [Paenibacillus marinisediminis]
MFKGRKWLAVIAALALLLEGVSLATVGVASVEAAAASTVKELRYKVGSDQAVANGTNLKIPKPFQVNGSTLVSISTLKSAFGMTFNWTVPNEEFILAAGNRKIEMAVGEVYALSNRKAIMMPTAPVVNNGNLMVPIRPVTEAINATIKLGTGGQTIVSWDAKEAQADMSRVGSSADKWSIYLPDEWLYVDDQDVGLTTFSDTSGEQYVTMEMDYVIDETADSADQLMAALTNDGQFDSMEIINGITGKIGNYPYAQVTAAEYLEDGTLGEEAIYRIYQANEKNYVLSAYGVDAAAIDGMLNSFRPAYVLSGVPANQKDPNQQSERSVVYDEYGVEVTLPVTWTTDTEYGYAYSQYGMYQFQISMQDAKGLTAAQVVKARNDYTARVYQPGVVKLIEEKPYKLADGKEGILQRVVMNVGKGKYTQYVLYVVDGSYNLNLFISDNYIENGTSDAVEHILKSIKIDASKIKDSLGTFGYMESWDAVVKHELKDLSASIELPKAWHAFEQDEEGWYEFAPPFGDMMGVFKLEDTSLLDVKLIDDEDFAEQDMIYNNVLDETKVINGHKVRILKYDYKFDRDDFERIWHAAYVEAGSDVIAICISDYKSSYSENVEKQFLKAIESFKFVK